jgi:hypothetical protein
MSTNKARSAKNNYISQAIPFISFQAAFREKIIDEASSCKFWAIIAKSPV